MEPITATMFVLLAFSIVPAAQGKRLEAQGWSPALGFWKELPSALLLVLSIWAGIEMVRSHIFLSLFHREVMHHSIQEHPSIITVIGFMNLALCAWVDKSGHWRYLLSVWPIAMGACALVGHVVGLEKLYFFWPPYSYGMPWPSALFFVLGGGVWIGLAYKWRPSGRWMIL